MAPRQRLIIRLPANPSTGYRWSLQKLSGTALKVDAAAEFDPDPGVSDRVGAAGTEIWRFVAAQEGWASLSFEYRRPWEKDAAPEQVLRYRVVVR